MSERARSSLDLGSGHRPAGGHRLDPEARPADSDQEPGDVHRRGREPPDDDRVHPGARERQRTPALHGPGRVLAVVHGALRQLRRGDGRRPRQGAGRDAAEDAHRNRGEPGDGWRPARTGAGGEPAQERRRHGAAPASSFRRTARSSKASRRSTSRRSPASRRPSFANPAAIARPSPAARASSRTGSRCASRPIPATRSWTG